jgi:hypothetical protein
VSKQEKENLNKYSTKPVLKQLQSFEKTMHSLQSSNENTRSSGLMMDDLEQASASSTIIITESPRGDKKIKKEPLKENGDKDTGEMGYSIGFMKSEDKGKATDMMRSTTTRFPNGVKAKPKSKV